MYCPHEKPCILTKTLSFFIIGCLCLCLQILLLSCSGPDDDDDSPVPTITATPTFTATPTTPILLPPEIISPADKLKTSSLVPLFVIRDGNADITDVSLSFVIATDPELDTIICADQLNESSGNFFYHYPSVVLTPGMFYFYSCFAMKSGYISGESEIRSLYIEEIGDNLPDSYLCLGDSITEWVPGSGTDYPSYLEEDLRGYFTESATTINVGIGGITAGALYQYVHDFLDHYRPAYSIILIGINDIEWPGLCLEPYNCETMDYITRMVYQCHANDTIPIVCTLTPSLYETEDILQQIDELNAAIRNFCLAENVDMVDLFEGFMAYEGNLEDLYIYDGEHPNEAGNDYMAQLIFTYFSNRFYNSSGTR